MKSTYEMVFLSDLLKKSRGQSQLHPDFQQALDFMFSRIDELSAASPNSHFNKLIRAIRSIVPRSFLHILLYRMRYDSLIWFVEENGQREIWGMTSFQRHPSRAMIGMFDIFIDPSRRNKDLVGNFSTVANMIYRMSQRFKNSGYEYLQCGKNETTRRLLRIYERILKKEYPDLRVDVEESRIYM